VAAESPPPAPAPAPAPRSPKPAPVRIAEVAILFDAATASAQAVADELAAQLPPTRYRITPVPLGSAESPLAELATRSLTVVAVGLKAVEAARTQLPGKPIVFCQVFGFEPLLAAGEKIWGVEPTPPAALQLRNWKAVDPTLHRVAVIVADARGSLAAAAAAAGQAASTPVRVMASSSDRETLYLFKRAAPEIDGLWLFPDNRVLSPTVLREVLAYAAAHGVGVLTFNDSLLPWGALLSAAPVPTDVADAVHRVLERVVAGKTADLPAMTPLSAVDVAVNAQVAGALGLPAVATTRWVAREPD
jgi:hypothetical protein